MCFPNKETSQDELEPLYQEDGSVNVDESYVTSVIPETIHHNIDSVYLLKYFDLSHEHAIFGFVYESGYELIIVYTSDEAQEYCEIEEELEDPFRDDPL